MSSSSNAPTPAAVSRCLVTGATDPDSVGYACARRLLQGNGSGSRRWITILGRDAARVSAAVARLRRDIVTSEEQSVFGVTADLRQPDAMPAAVQEAVALMGGEPLNVLVVSGGNGGSEYLGGSCEDIEAYRMLQNVAVLSPMMLTHAAVKEGCSSKSSTDPQEQQRPPLSVVMVSSMASNTPWPDTAPYNTAKAAQNCLVQQLAMQYRGQNVRVNAVLAGCIWTAMLDRMAHKKNVPVSDYAALRADAIPVGRNGTPDDVAGAVEFLATPSSAAFVTGVLLPVDGGLHMSNWFNKPKLMSEFQGNARLSGK